MRVFIAALVLIFSLQSLTKADDIRDFQIEGISVGDSLLDYYTKDEILENKYYAYSNKSYFQTYFMLPESNKYTSIQFNIKNGSTKFIVQSIEGAIHPISFNECKQKKNKIENELKSIFNNLEIEYEKEAPVSSDPTGLSIGISTNLLFGKTFTDGPAIRIMCVDRSKKIEKEKGWVDSLRVVINSKEFNNFLENN